MQPPLTQPGVYPGPGKAVLLRANEQQYLFQQQLITAGQASIAVQLERIKAASYPFGVSLQVWFTDVNEAAITPGAFQIDWQDSDLDIDALYVPVSSLVGTAALNATFAGRIELPLVWTKFMRVSLKTFPNAGVYSNALVSR
jgi:hypothetical protein